MRSTTLALALSIAIACLSHGTDAHDRSHAALVLGAGTPRRPTSETSQDLLQNDIRRRIYDYIVANPNATRNLLQKKVHPSASSLEWHLRKLSRAGLIGPGTTGLRTYRATRPVIHRTTPAFDNDKRRRIFEIVAQNPGADRNVIRRHVPVSTSTIDWHLDKLVHAGLLVRAANGDHRYFPAPKVPSLADRQRPPGSRSGLRATS